LLRCGRDNPKKRKDRAERGFFKTGRGDDLSFRKRRDRHFDAVEKWAKSRNGEGDGKTPETPV